MRSNEIRKTFLEFFAERGHAVRPSAGIIPAADPTLMFNSAGMVPFKSLWTDAPLEFSRATSCQKCLRVGGKDSDLENVGRTLRHHSFFEMLGNFSFGDYFKKEAIEWAWEFVIDVMGLEKEQLWVTIFQDDDEAHDLWKKLIGILDEKIIRLGKKDNFWGPAGSSGPCGPCSEIYFDRGPEFGCGKPDCRPGCDCERYFEFWNLVFPQFYQDESGEREQLARRGIDTGMGLERLALLSQGVTSNYDTDLFMPIIAALTEISPAASESSNRESCHVIADHIRALTFALAENVLPSNEGRGYVIRRLLRRAARFGRKLGMEDPFLSRLVPSVVEVMKEPYPELLEAREHISRIIRAEEDRF
ncbi:MAG: alanine--tRNA ligase-related protein, partial [Candidatus Auribacterota bacterium]|nr:alanine--tRNA ligase-related protein [Candidatus Auribacterota bacterium]